MLIIIFFCFFKFTTYVGADGETDYGMADVEDVDDVKPKLLLYNSLMGKKRKTSSTTSTSTRKKIDIETCCLF